MRPNEALATPLGEDRLGGVVDINFSSSNSPHLLIGGTRKVKKLIQLAASKNFAFSRVDEFIEETDRESRGEWSQLGDAGTSHTSYPVRRKPHA